MSILTTDLKKNLFQFTAHTFIIKAPSHTEFMLNWSPCREIQFKKQGNKLKTVAHDKLMRKIFWRTWKWSSKECAQLNCEIKLSMVKLDLGIGLVLLLAIVLFSYVSVSLGFCLQRILGLFVRLALGQRRYNNMWSCLSR